MNEPFLLQGQEMRAHASHTEVFFKQESQLSLLFVNSPIQLVDGKFKLVFLCAQIHANMSLILENNTLETVIKGK